MKSGNVSFNFHCLYCKRDSSFSWYKMSAMFPHCIFSRPLYQQVVSPLAKNNDSGKTEKGNIEKRLGKDTWTNSKVNQIWRIKTNEELDKLIKHKNIVHCIKAQRLSWFGHVQRMPDTRTVKKIFKWKPLTKRSQGRPKYRLEDNIKQDICQMKIKNWIACVQDRGKWKDVVEKAKTCNH